jgi:magnesium transporter
MAVLPSLPSLPSFTPIFRHAPKTPALRSAIHPDAIVDCAAYIDGKRVPSCTDPIAAIDWVRSRGRGFVWIGLHEPDTDEMSVIADLFGLHELAVEDAVHAYQRPKMDRYDNSLFLVLKTVCYVEHTRGSAIEIVQNGEIMMFLGADFIVTVRHGEHSQLKGVRAALESDPEQLAIGPAAVMHAISDRIVDEYLSVVEAVEDDIDEMENAVFTTEKSVDIEQIYLLKREIGGLRRAVSPLTPALRSLSGSSLPQSLVPAEIREYFRDVEDHLSVVAERVSTFDEMLTTLVSAALAEVTTRQNEDMRKISAWAAIALVPTAIAGIYGMNFEHMPELTWTYGYPMALALIAGLCISLFMLLRRRGWL